MAAIALIVGLGNPGADYAATRHNAGFWCVDAIAAAGNAAWRKESRFSGELARYAEGGQECRLFKPMTFMNDCGRTVAAAARYFGIETAELLIAHDEIDLPPGTVRLKIGGGHGGHNGLRDITTVLGSSEFARIRLGVGRPPPGGEGADHVLSRPGRADRALIDAAIDRVLTELPRILAGEHEAAMNALHRPAADA
jgi:PTH1 family peptidyl-tRNA hydrolase